MASEPSAGPASHRDSYLRAAGRRKWLAAPRAKGQRMRQVDGQRTVKRHAARVGTWRMARDGLTRLHLVPLEVMREMLRNLALNRGRSAQWR